LRLVVPRRPDTESRRSLSHPAGEDAPRRATRAGPA
jgi:hypothetical protein